MQARDLEKTGYFGYLFFIKYDGTKFDSFDENKNGISVKGEFRKILEKNNIGYYKGIQQAGRTDKDVSAQENILYINTKQKLKLNKLKYIKDFMIISEIRKTFPYLNLPELVYKRHYVYKYPVDKITKSREEIEQKCKELSGKYDMSEFTTKKGKKLKEKVREVTIYYQNDELHFEGTSFMPQQVRIMSGYILKGKKQPLEGKYLTLKKIIISQELESMMIYKDDIIKVENVEEVERSKNYIFFYVKKSKKGEFIGTKGKNIKNLRKKFGQIIIKEI